MKNYLSKLAKNVENMNEIIAEVVKTSIKMKKSHFPINFLKKVMSWAKIIKIR